MISVEGEEAAAKELTLLKFICSGSNSVLTDAALIAQRCHGIIRPFVLNDLKLNRFTTMPQRTGFVLLYYTTSHNQGFSACYSIHSKPLSAHTLVHRQMHPMRNEL